MVESGFPNIYPSGVAAYLIPIVMSIQGQMESSNASIKLRMRALSAPKVLPRQSV